MQAKPTDMHKQLVHARDASARSGARMVTEADVIFRRRNECTYVPVDVFPNGHGRRVHSHVKWACIDIMNLKEPFYKQEKRRWKPLNTSVQFLMDYADSLSAPRDPAGIIMHMSRCGSTLAARMLASLPSLVVLQEPNHLGDLLEEDCVGSPMVLRLIRAIYRAHAALPAQRSNRLVIKSRTLSPEHLHRPFRCARAAFPSTPIFFVHRDPMAVWESNLRRPPSAFYDAGYGALNVSSNHEPTTREPTNHKPNNHEARADVELLARWFASNVAGILQSVLGYFHHAAARGEQEPMRLIPYERLRTEMPAVALGWLNVNASAADLSAMQTVASSHSHLLSDGTRIQPQRDDATRVHLVGDQNRKQAILHMGAPYEGLIALQRAQDSRDREQLPPTVPVQLSPGAGCASLAPVHELSDERLATALTQAFEIAILKLAAIDSVLSIAWRPNPRLNSIHLANGLTHDLIRTCVLGALKGRPCTLFVREHRLLNHMQQHAHEIFELDVALGCLNRAANVALLALFTTDEPNQFTEQLLAMNLQALGIWTTRTAAVSLPTFLHPHVCLKIGVPIFAHVVNYFLGVALSGRAFPQKWAQLRDWTDEVICDTLNPHALATGGRDCAIRDLDSVLQTSAADEVPLLRAIRLWRVCRESKRQQSTPAAQLTAWKLSLSETLRQLSALTSAVEDVRATKRRAGDDRSPHDDGYEGYVLRSAVSVAWQSYRWLHRNHPRAAAPHQDAFEAAMERASVVGAWAIGQHPTGSFAPSLHASPWWPLDDRHPSIDMARQLLASSFRASRAEWQAWHNSTGPTHLPTLADKWALINGGDAGSSYTKLNESINESQPILWAEHVLAARVEGLHGPLVLARHFPATMALIRAVDAVAQVSKASFSVLQPGGNIEPHHGNNNLAQRHMLVIDNGCGSGPAPCAFLSVGNESRALHPAGTVLTFDDSFEHEVWHHGTEPRVVLLLEVLHPHLLECDAKGRTCQPSAAALERVSYESVYSCARGPGSASDVHDEQPAGTWKANWAVKSI